MKHFTQNLLPLFILSIFSVSCQNILEKNEILNERDCSCPFEKMVDHVISRDSSIVYDNEKDIFDWSIDGKISARIKEILNVEIEANKPLNYNVSTKNVVTTITNDFPELDDEIYKLKTGRLFFCTYHQLLCRDTSISIKDLTALSILKLRDFENSWNNKNIPSKASLSNDTKKKPRAKVKNTNLKIKGNENNTIIGNDNNLIIKQETNNSKNHRQRLTNVFYEQKKVLDAKIKNLNFHIQKRGNEFKGKEVLSNFYVTMDIVIPKEGNIPKTGKQEEELARTLAFFVDKNTTDFIKNFKGFLKLYLDSLNEKNEIDYLLSTAERQQLANLFCANYDFMEFHLFFKGWLDYWKYSNSRKSVADVFITLSQQEIRNTLEILDLIKQMQKQCSI